MLVDYVDAKPGDIIGHCVQGKTVLAALQRLLLIHMRPHQGYLRDP